MVTNPSVKMWDKLRRFGLEYCDLPTTLENVADLLRLLALNVDGRKQGIPILFAIMTCIMVSAFIYVHVVSMLWFVFWRGTEDIMAKILISSLSIASSLSLVKLFGMHLYSNRVRKAMVAFLARDQLVDRNSRMYRSLLMNMRVVKRRAITVWVTLLINGMAYLVKPYMMPGRHLTEDKQVLYGLEPMFETPNYEISHTILGLTVVLIIFSSNCITAFLIIVVGYIEAQVRALSNEILHLWDDAQDVHGRLARNGQDAHALMLEEYDDFQKNREKKLKNQNIKRQLESIAQAHAANLSLLRLIDNVFNRSIAVEFGLLGTAMISVLLGGLQNTYLVVLFTFLHITVDCFIGQQLMEASWTFREAVYACKWENFDASNMKMVLLILQNSNTMVITAGGIAEMGYGNLMWVFKSIYSAYTTLRSTINLEAN